MSDDVLAMAAEDAANIKVTDGDIDAISRLAERQLFLAIEVERLEEELKEAKKNLVKVEEQDLPEAMDRVGMEEFKLSSGAKIKISTIYSGSITAERKEEAMEWLDEHGHGSIIKSAVSVPFERGDIEVAKAFIEFARGFNGGAITPELVQSVHYQTLRAFIREQIEGGGDMPHDLFGVFIGRNAKITLPKSR